MQVEADQWQFLNNDPQFHIDFPQPVYGLHLVCEVEEGSFEKGTSLIYYRKEGEDFAEERKCEWNFKVPGKIERELRFEEAIHSIRFDPVDFEGTCRMKQFTLEVLEEEEKPLSEGGEREEKIAVMTHEMSTSGAPILAYHIAEGLKNAGKDVTALTRCTNDGFLEKKYTERGIPVINLESPQESEYGYLYLSLTDPQGVEKYKDEVFRQLRNQGYTTVIANTIVSGQYVELLKDYGFRIISLIHEMKGGIELFGHKGAGAKIADYADYIVFPNEWVQEDFMGLFPEISGECLICSQGIYLKETAGGKKAENLEEYGIQKDDTVIMSSGTCDLRKGVDLFIQAALLLCRRQKGKKIHFVWTGDFYHADLEYWLMNQIEKSGFCDNFHFIPFIKDTEKYGALLRRADLFWAMSREDPFPSTVLEAMNNRVLVMGFKNTGGIQTMLSDRRGILVDGFYLEDFVSAAEHAIYHKEDYAPVLDAAQGYVKKLDFAFYVNFLLECAKKEKKTTSSLDWYRWGRKKYYRNCQLRQKSLEEKEAELIQAKKKDRFQRKRISKDKVILLDTAKGSDNVGDEIIMDYCTKACREALPGAKFLHIPTHIYDGRAERTEGYFKILCGTNLIYTRMEDSWQWALPDKIENYKHICLLGAGMQQLGIDLPMSEYTKNFLHYILDAKCIHSVRDAETKNRLEEAGIKNVLNTGCPTMWGLTPEHCAKIPVRKSGSVLTTVSDYMKDRENDLFLLQTLEKHYKKVYIWIQGQFDYPYLKELVDTRKYVVLPPTLEALDHVLKTEEVDYIGTRLHAGVRSLNYGHRTVVIRIDNRAQAIARDTNLPVLERQTLQRDLEERIYREEPVRIRLPEEEIRIWKNQFQKGK